jgi:GNAT superfamily N-acetyltransferase
MTYEVFRIPAPPSEEDVTKYSQLRLLGLKTNPEAFGSTFERESMNTKAEWRTRIDKKERFTIIARLVSTDAEDSIAREEWVGTASILIPEMMGAHTYGVVGMWVHPEHRRKGRALLYTGKKNLTLVSRRPREETARIWDRMGSRPH